MQGLIERAQHFTDREAIVSDGQVFTYEELLAHSAGVASALLNGREDLGEARVAFIVPPSFAYVACQWGIWRAGGVAVPLCVDHPLPSLRYVLEDSGAETLIAHKDYEELLRGTAEELGVRVVLLEGLTMSHETSSPPPKVAAKLTPSQGNLSPTPLRGRGAIENAKRFEAKKGSTPEADLQRAVAQSKIENRESRIENPDSRRAQILYTSGTTSLPKGVVTTHANIENQVKTLVDAWGWSADDRILNILPLHHVHGIINVLSCALWSGARCEFLPRFDAHTVWEKMASGAITRFMAVPTIYYKLIAHWEKLGERDQTRLSAGARNLNLMISGSAALPVPTLERWREITGHTLLERYGMTEIGMGLSNSYRGERRPGHVGRPLPGVEMRLADEEGNTIHLEHTPGEIQIKGPSVFKEYWQKPEATARAFTDDGWFLTGDVAELNDGLYRILGRDSVDIIKSGGYKISALEIEAVLLRHELVDECAVVGLPDEEWGEVIAAAIVSSGAPEPKALTAWLRERIPAYRLPRRWLQLDELPRNTLGKVTKNELKKIF